VPIAEVNGINIYYETQGLGEPLILIMGFSGRGSDWKFQTAEFKKRYRVITLDNRGVGKSDKPQGRYTTKIMADDVIGLMDYLKIKKAHILGASMGGMIAQEIAINYPERVIKLILACTYAYHDKESSGMTQDMEEAIKLPIRVTTSRVIDLAMSKFLLRISFLPLMKIRFRFMGELEARGLEGQRDACLGHNALERLSQINAPTLVIVGTKDKVLKPSSSEVIARKVPKARLVKAENGSHVFSMEMRGIFNKEVLNFLNRA
jgi:pimeloyl-ACP methyl ester carboxylesterase